MIDEIRIDCLNNATQTIDTGGAVKDDLFSECQSRLAPFVLLSLTAGRVVPNALLTSFCVILNTVTVLSIEGVSTCLYVERQTPSCQLKASLGRLSTFRLHTHTLLTELSLPSFPSPGTPTTCVSEDGLKTPNLRRYGEKKKQQQQSNVNRWMDEALYQHVKLMSEFSHDLHLR